MCPSRNRHRRGLEDIHRLSVNVFFQLLIDGIPSYQVNWAAEDAFKVFFDMNKLEEAERPLKFTYQVNIAVRAGVATGH